MMFDDIQETKTKLTEILVSRTEHRSYKRKTVERTVTLYQDGVRILTVSYFGDTPGTSMAHLEATAWWAYRVRKSLLDNVFATKEFRIEFAQEPSQR